MALKIVLTQSEQIWGNNIHPEKNNALQTLNNSFRFVLTISLIPTSHRSDGKPIFSDSWQINLPGPADGTCFRDLWPKGHQVHILLFVSSPQIWRMKGIVLHFTTQNSFCKAQLLTITYYFSLRNLKSAKIITPQDKRMVTFAQEN